VYQELLADASFFGLLLQFDRDLAAKAREAGCQFCGDVMHRADYLRHPKGGPLGASGLGEDFEVRFSFCCRREGCRKRSTPASVRFLGRRIYLGAIVVLVSALREGPTPTRLAKLQELVGVCARTVRRWQRWWKEQFPQSAVWRAARGLLAFPVTEEGLPGSLLERFNGSASDRVLALLRLLAS
jgi:hypothetical protein